MKLRIYPLPLVKLLSGPLTTLPGQNVAQDTTESYTSIWYIEGGQKRILVDSGGTADIMVKRGINAQHIATPVESLKAFGISPQDIDIVIITHLHNDHNVLGHLYTKARFIIQKAELEANFKPHPLEAPRTIPEGALAGLDFEIITGDAPVQKGVNILSTPGHTRGGQSVSVDTEQGKVIICGLCCNRSNFYPSEPMSKIYSVVPPMIHLDACQAYDSLLRVKQEADIILYLHDKYTTGEPIPNKKSILVAN